MHACARARSGRTGALRRSLSSVRRKRAHEAAASCARSPERPGPWAAAAPRACGWCASARSAALRSFCAAWTPCAWRCARHSLHVRLRLCGLSSRRLAPADVARCGMARLERVDMDMGRCGVMHGRHGACTRVALAIAPRRTTRGGVRRAACRKNDPRKTHSLPRKLMCKTWYAVNLAPFLNPLPGSRSRTFAVQNLYWRLWSNLQTRFYNKNFVRCMSKVWFFATAC